MNLNDIRLKKFIDLETDEKLMVLSWRNNINNRKWMYNSEMISEKEHFHFLDTLIKRESEQYFLVQNNKQNIGVVYFNQINKKTNSCYFGLYSNPFEKVAGVGRILEEICIKYAFEVLKLDTLKLEVFYENEKAKALYKKYNFQETGYKIVNGKNVICMELERKGKI
ncbi:UDP-4-amino-4,6-dideoxy-N-acetyl-beta-L-altrosamine N-acetyltransferase [Arcobacter sp. AHV-9/2010]|uniref:UDP-4-amino-4, 6-dideoxy-N-acetyl-beta-L-altrosamine N-acetyltransferase n=1 Tax=Arcobacter sp. AHV-9/2010 TaxID=2021861 RepID=UPI00100AEDD3|nr:UDP-4-amino-4,6-dideoxy-N-acetyl-beta-L-altrosamine N-acetyltransferase [Arcobacter sp. CECT 9299]RXJ95489.1 UDP-4-amino-4,6-dideoxy-N-acetyl-beta-L-altrosamine N-acetyltransferase [Arcobacter sp. CECT 9299]